MAEVAPCESHDERVGCCGSDPGFWLDPPPTCPPLPPTFPRWFLPAPQHPPPEGILRVKPDPPALLATTCSVSPVGWWPRPFLTQLIFHFKISCLN